MISEKTKNLADRAKAIFQSTLREKLESEHWGKFVAIEPDSKDYFVADSFGDAVRASRDCHPDRIAYVIRVGYQAAIHIGALTN
ncbi:hypothetical protein SH449x_002183 [Pirellulaceae bacterium SH449]